ncbi:site-specific integrase [Halorussus limi]|uniref:Site-specific integrase n=2 Tax=Halorussus TaxID=1070314 RepID=A0A8U0IFX8_9EURY|nr:MULTISPECIES: site-specific integrase [Halorussus]UPV73956.1 site-specific integrase [Halorussus limi]UPV99996.1 site-specific integrase [Halorussus gelatinilyticus]
MKNADEATTPLEGITVVPEPSAELLNERQQIDYRNQREQCLEWLLVFGKDPKKAEGYARTTVKNRAHRMDQFYRWVWDQDGYTTNVTHDHADAYLTWLAKQDHSNAHKDNCRKALLMLYKWREHEHGLDEWDPELSFSTGHKTTTPRDYLTREERGQIREAALEYGSVPSYKGLDSEERDRWKAYLAQRFEKPKSEVTPEDWDEANGWKIPSLVSVSLDAGLRPIEVERAVTGWVDIENAVLRIPKEQSSKNTGHWIVGLQDRTAETLDRWLEQRENDPTYDDTDKLWLTRFGNTYGSASLRKVLRRLCDQADIPYENRQMSWYSIRHSTGTYMTREEDLAAAQAQLRHKSPETTMKYDQAPVEDRQNALDRMG